jgi:hypothetical protein
LSQFLWTSSKAIRIPRPFVGLLHTTGIKRVQFFIALLLKIGQRIEVKRGKWQESGKFLFFSYYQCLV